MPYPSGARVITVVGQWLNIDGAAARGAIEVTFVKTEVDNDVIYTHKPLRVELDGNGEVEFQLVKTSEPMQINILEELDGSKPRRRQWTATIREASITDDRFNLADGTS